MFNAEYIMCGICDTPLMDEERHFECEAESANGEPMPVDGRLALMVRESFITRRFLDAEE